jgi:hypothetical protein
MAVAAVVAAVVAVTVAAAEAATADRSGNQVPAPIKGCPGLTPGHFGFTRIVRVDSRQMAIATLSLSRRHVLGTLYGRCDPIEGSIPVYLAGGDPDLLGYADQSLGHYADAFSFHLDTDSCKKLSAGQYSYDIGYDHSEPHAKGERGRVKLTSITLIRHKGYDKPVKVAKLEAVKLEAVKLDD